MQAALEFSSYPVRTLEDVENAVAAGQRDEVSAFSVGYAPWLAARVPQVATMIAKTNKPACGPYPVWARGAGGGTAAVFNLPQ